MAESLTPPILPDDVGTTPYEAPAADPTPKAKVVAGGLAGAATTIILFILASVGVDIPGEVGAAITTILSVLFAYITSER